MTGDKIGDAAGTVWAALRNAGTEGLTVTEIKRKTNGYTGDEVAAAIGWLARESKLVFETAGRKTLVSLAENELEEIRELVGSVRLG